MIESAMARYRLLTVPQFVVGAATLSAVAFIILLV
jgi:formate hydrogenlyase subunit 4